MGLYSNMCVSVYKTPLKNAAVSLSMTEVTDDEAALQNQQSGVLPSPRPHSSLFSFCLSLHSSFLFSISFGFLICVIGSSVSLSLWPYLFPLTPLLIGWREAIPPQLCQVCPLSHDVPGRRGDVPYR